MRAATAISHNQGAGMPVYSFKNSKMPVALTDRERARLQSALNAALVDSRICGLLSREPLAVGRNVSVTSQRSTVYDYLQQMRNCRAPVNGATPEEALRSLAGNGREYGSLQDSFETMLGVYSRDVLCAMQKALRDMRPLRNRELHSGDF